MIVNNVKNVMCRSLATAFSKKGISCAMGRTFSIYTGAYNFYCYYSLLASAIANILCLQTLRHGTNLFNYASINVKGGCPSKGGRTTELLSTIGAGKNVLPLEKQKELEKMTKWAKEEADEGCKGYFFLFKDSEFAYSSGLGPSKRTLDKLRFMLFKRFFPYIHSSISSASVFRKDLKTFRCYHYLLSSLLFFCSPTLRFHMTEEEIVVKELENDPKYDGAAYKTRQKISPKYIGITGSLTQGLNLGLFGRIKRHPDKFLLGIVQLTVVVAIAAFALQIGSAVAAKAACEVFIVSKVGGFMIPVVNTIASVGFHALTWTV